MSLPGLVELAAWFVSGALMAWLLRDAWLTGRRYDEHVLTSSREGEIEKNLAEVAKDLEAIESGVDRIRDPHA